MSAREVLAALAAARSDDPSMRIFSDTLWPWTIAGNPFELSWHATLRNMAAPISLAQARRDRKKILAIDEWALVIMRRTGAGVPTLAHEALVPLGRADPRELGVSPLNPPGEAAACKGVRCPRPPRPPRPDPCRHRPWYNPCCDPCWDRCCPPPPQFAVCPAVPSTHDRHAAASEGRHAGTDAELSQSKAHSLRRTPSVRKVYDTFQCRPVHAMRGCVPFEAARAPRVRSTNELRSQTLVAIRACRKMRGVRRGCASGGGRHVPKLRACATGLRAASKIYTSTAGV